MSTTTPQHPSLQAKAAPVTGGMRPPCLLDRFPKLDAGILQDPAEEADAIHAVLGAAAQHRRGRAHRPAAARNLLALT